MSDQKSQVGDEWGTVEDGAEPSRANGAEGAALRPPATPTFGTPPKALSFDERARATLPGVGRSGRGTVPVMAAVAMPPVIVPPPTPEAVPSQPLPRAPAPEPAPVRAAAPAPAVQPQPVATRPK